MSVQKAKKFFESLNPQQKQFVADKTISASISIKNWIAFLNKASIYDRYADEVVTTSTGIIVTCVILTIFSFFIPFIFEQTLLFIVPVLAVLVTYFFIQRKNSFKKRDINNYFRLFFMPFLEMLRVKAGEETKLSATLDFRDPKKSIPPVKSMVGSRDLKTYQPKYIIAKVMLLDGAYLEIVIADDIKVFSYTNSNGKSKSKTKTVHHFFVRLSLPKYIYRLKNQPLPGDVTMEEVPNEYIFKLKGKHKDNDYVLLKLSVFIAGLQSLFNLVEEINPSANVSDGSTIAQPKKATEKKEHDSSVTDSDYSSNSSSSDIPFLLWSDSLFNRHDYDSTTERGDVPLIMDEANTLSVFQS